MDDATAIGLAVAKMTGDVDALYDYLEPMVGKTRARKLTDHVKQLPTRKENLKRVNKALERKRAGGGATTDDVNALKERLAELEELSRKNEELLEQYRADQEETRKGRGKE